MNNIKLALKAWCVGLLSAGVVFLPLSRVWGESDATNLMADIALRVSIFVLSIPPSILMAATLGLVLSAPLFLIALIFALIFEQAAERNPKKISVLAVIVTVLVVAGTDTITRDNIWASNHNFFEKFSHISLTWDTWLFALPVGVGSYFFCFKLRQRNARSNEKVEWT